MNINPSIQKQKNIARSRINILFREAESIAKKNSRLADSYVGLARKIAMKTRIRIPKDLKRKFCKDCYSYLTPGINCRVRTKNSKVVYYCLVCKKYSRYPFLREREST